MKVSVGPLRYLKRKTATATASAFLLLIAPHAATAQMIFTMESDGSLRPSQPQDRFARNYNDGIGQGDANAPLTIFGDGGAAANDGNGTGTSDESFRVAVVAPRVAAPRPEILAAMVVGTLNMLTISWAMNSEYPVFAKLEEAREMFEQLICKDKT